MKPKTISWPTFCSRFRRPMRPSIHWRALSVIASLPLAGGEEIGQRVNLPVEFPHPAHQFFARLVVQVHHADLGAVPARLIVAAVLEPVPANADRALQRAQRVVLVEHSALG